MSRLGRDLGAIARLFVIRGLGMLALFAAIVLIGRQGGAAAQGMFQTALAWAIVAATAARLGQDQALLRVTAEYRAKGDASAADRQLTAALVLTLPLLLMATLVLLAIVRALPGETHPALIAMAFAVLPMGLLMVITEAMRGWQMVDQAMFWQGAFAPVILAAGVWMIGPTVLIAPIAALIYGGAAALAALLAYVGWRRGLRPGGFAWPTVRDLGAAVRQGWNFWLFTLLATLAAWVDVLVLERIAPADVVGNYAAIVRTGAVLGTVVQIASAGAVARLAMLYADNDMPAFVRLSRRYVWLFVAAAVPVAVGVTLFPHAVMAIWGRGYTESPQLFAVYGLAQAFNFAIAIFYFVAPVMHLERALAAIQLFNVAVKAAGIVIAYRLAGFAGVVWAASLVLVVANGMVALLFFRRLSERDVRPAAFLRGR